MWSVMTCNISVVSLWGMWYLWRSPFMNIISTTCVLQHAVVCWITAHAPIQRPRKSRHATMSSLGSASGGGGSGERTWKGAGRGAGGRLGAEPPHGARCWCISLCDPMIKFPAAPAIEISCCRRLQMVAPKLHNIWLFPCLKISHIQI
jgi:hypothetical protein